MSRLRKFLALPASEQWLLAVAFVKLAWTSPGLRLIPFSYWKPRIQASDLDLLSSPSPGISAERIGWAVATAAHYVPGATCLVQALVARDLLHRHGYPARIRLGVDAGTELGFRAHAWVECHGHILLGGAEAGYAPLPVVGAH